MSDSHFPQTAKPFEIQAYRRPKDPRELRKTHVAFTGSPQKHPTDEDALILVADPYSDSTLYYEIRARDIAYAEPLPSVVDMDGRTVNTVRVWVKKGSLAVLCSPFIVAETGRPVR